jgi:hypothetical protein
VNVSTQIAAALGRLIDDLAVEFEHDGRRHTATVRAHQWGPKKFRGPGPWAVVQLPAIDRTGLEEPESQVGTEDWDLEFPVVFYFELTGAPEFVQEQAIAVIEAFIAAVDSDPLLSSAEIPAGQIEEAKVTAAGPPELDVDQQRPLLVYPCDVALLALVDRT